MRRHRTWNWTDLSEVWPVLLLLLVVAIPAACVAWFTRQAIRTERLAAQQRLNELYSARLKIASEVFTDRVRLAVERAEELAQAHPAAEAFHLAIADQVCSSLIIFDAEGRVRYPCQAAPSALTALNDTGWADAQRLESEALDYQAAADAYQRLSQASSDPALVARALQARARCLIRNGDTGEALRIITEDLGQGIYRNVLDPTGRSLVAAMELQGLQLLQDDHPDFLPLARRLASRLVQREGNIIPSGQRRFIAGRLMTMKDWFTFFPDVELAVRLFQAEDIAAEVAALAPKAPQDALLHASGTGGVWAIGCEGGRALALFDQASLLAFAEPIMAPDPTDTSYALQLVPPYLEPPPDTYLLSMVRGFAGWRFAIAVKDPGGSSELAAAERISTYLWIGVLVVSVMLVLATLIGHAFRSQVRLARLKNDLVATVTHELKTPLASMRLLLDTLLEAEGFDEVKVREYLELVAKENTRLTRLIDNFLTFSRMERRKYTFHFADHSVAGIVSDAVAAAGDRFHAHDCRLDVMIGDGLGTIHADADALVTVLLNLLDNAYKYSAGHKRIGLRVEPECDMIRFSVSDNGIGMSRAEQRRVFERFYQVDQTLTRPAGGCGLGLSIVKFIVASHHGRVLVDSQPGQGSTFHVLLPLAMERTTSLEEATV